MSDDTKILRPERTAECETSTGVCRPIAPTLIETPRGVVEVIDAPGILSMRLDGTGPLGRRAGVVLYSPALAGEPHGIGMLHQLDADAARSIAASLLRLANDLDGRKPN